MTIKKASFQVFWIKMGCYQHNMKWEELISVQLFCRFFASESIRQIQIWHELLYPKIHNENEHLGFCRFMQRMIAAYKSSSTDTDLFSLSVQKLRCVGQPSCFRTRSWNQMHGLELYLQMRWGVMWGKAFSMHILHQLIKIWALEKDKKSETTNGKMDLWSFSERLC